MAIYRRSTTCTKGHSVVVLFDWDPLRTGDQKNYLGICPVRGCDGEVAGKLPIGTDPDTLKLSPGPSHPGAADV